MKKLIPKAQNGINIQKQDAIKSFIPKEKVKSIPLTLQQQNNWKMFGQLNQPEQQQTQLSQGYKKTPQQKHQAEVRLAQQEKFENYQKQEKKDAENIQHAIEVAPYLIPGVGQAMWAGKAVDLVTNKLSNNKYQSWGDMVDKNVGGSHAGVDKFVADLTNPGYYAGALAKVASPLVKEGIKNVGEYLTIRTPLKDAWKLNPYAFKPNPEAYYRGVGKEGIDDIFESGIIKSKKQHAYPEPYFSKGVIGDKYAKGYFAELTGEPMKGVGSFPEGSLIQTPVNIVDINNQNLKLYQKDWLRGYKEIPKPSYVSPTQEHGLNKDWNFGITKPGDEIPYSSDYLNVYKRSGKNYIKLEKQQVPFKSEINWGNWNKEIPSNKPLMDEYLQIEKSSKQNGTWMKNSDGSNFKGTPEQFVQQNSSNFKKAFPQNAEITYRGIKNNTPDLLNNRAMFTADKRLAKTYTTNDEILTPFNTVDDKGLYEMYRKKSDNGIELDVRGSHWKDLNISNKITPRSYFKKQIWNKKNNLKYNNSRLSDPNLDVAEIPYLLNNKKYLENELKYFQDGLLNRKDMVNREGVTNLKKHFKNLENISTNDIAEYVENKNLDYIKLKNVSDNLIGTETILNHKPGNYLKSTFGNNGMFDMTNPNIYKAIVPAAGLYGLTQSKKQGGKLIPRNK